MIGMGLAAWTIASAPAPGSAQSTIGLNLSINCASGRPMSILSTVEPSIAAVVIRLVSKAQAQVQLSNKERITGEQIDPAYLQNQRVMVQWRIATNQFARSFVLVPTGMVVRVGETVVFVPSHGDPDNLCLYIPSLIVP